MEPIKIRDVRKLTPLANYRFNSFTGHFISSAISPIFTAWFVKRGTRPNTITIYMILAGVLGAVLFAFDNMWLKIAGFALFHFWFIMDCSDGEVARITKQFSKYGKEIDFMAHLICHPLMNLALWWSFIQLGTYNTLFLSAFFMAFISVELVNRSLVLFNTYLVDEDAPKASRPSLVLYFLRQITSYPNFMLLFPGVFLIDYFYGYHISAYVLMLWGSFYMLLSVRMVIKRLIHFNMS